MKKKVLSLVLALVLVLGCLPLSASAAGDAVSMEEIKQLLNAEPLHPQRTGYQEVDQILENITAPTKGQDTYTRIKALYTWAVDNIAYDWEGYSQSWAPAYDKFTLKYNLTYDSALPEAYPKDMIYRTYHSLTARKGVCYDWAILFTVMARYIGIEGYTHTGILYRATDGFRGHHGWTELKLGGVGYIFDTQQDNRCKRWAGGRVTYEHFGILASTAWRFTPERAVNAARDKTLRPLVSTVTVKSLHPEAVAGGGVYEPGATVTLSAMEGRPVSGWYTPDGKLLSQENAYAFTLKKDTTVLALFEEDLFTDTPVGKYYYDAVKWAVENDITSGTSAATFGPDDSCTRAQAVTFLWKAAGKPEPVGAGTGFADVKADDYFEKAVRWAVENGITSGTGNEKFSPSDKCTRAQIITFLWKVNGSQPAEGGAADSFGDVASSAYYADAVAWAVENGITSGTGNGTFSPNQKCTRAQIVTFLYQSSK